jgi:non-specific serine/threonine protein kinase
MQAELATHAQAHSDTATAARALRLQTAADPLDENAHRGLMQTLAQGGAPGAAVDAYRKLRLRLADELATEPAPETRALYHRIRAEARGGGAPLASPPAPIKDRIPRPLTPLVGRADEVGEIEARLAESRLVTLTGSGGAGKTRLAMKVASDVATGFADGAWFVELAPVAQAELVARTMASALDVKEAPHRPLEVTLVDFLRPRQALMVLDNCEHLVGACAELTALLLRECPHLRVLATSRQSLGLSGEVVWRVPPLAEGDAVELFRERAASSEPWSPAEREAVAQICSHLDGLPLAIELAAARTKVLSVGQIAARLDDRFRLLTGGGRTAPSRQRTLKATVEWSYQLLTPSEQALLRRLSVFQGGWSLDGAEAVYGGEVLDLLGQLVDKSLVVFSGRYHLLETVREFALAQLAALGESALARQAHLEHFLGLAEAAEPHIFGGEVDREWIRRLDEEHDNLRAAFDWCEADGERVGFALRLASAVHWFWFARSHLREGHKRLTAALARRERAPLRDCARALSAAGYLAMWMGNYAAMSPLLNESLAIARRLDDQRLAALAQCGLGAAAVLSGDAAAARPPLEEAAAHARQIDDGMLAAFVAYWLASAELAQGEFARAQRSLVESLALARRIGYRPAIGHTLYLLAQAAQALGDHVGARAHYVESLRVLDEMGDRWGMCQALDALGRLAAAEAQAERAALLLGAAEALCEATGAARLRDRADYERAVASAQEALGAPAFAATWAEGRGLSLAQVVAYAAAGVVENTPNRERV